MLILVSSHQNKGISSIITSFLEIFFHLQDSGAKLIKSNVTLGDKITAYKIPVFYSGKKIIKYNPDAKTLKKTIFKKKLFSSLSVNI